MGINLSKGSVIPHLPDLVIAEISSGLPIKSIVRCRCVCKTWLNLISSSYFNDLILKKRSSPTFIGVKPSGLRARGYFLLEFPHRTDLIKTTSCPVESMKLNSKLFPGPVVVVGNCNGLLCLLDLKTRLHIHVWNPVLSQYITFPIDFGTGITIGYGFGCDPTSNQYKVIRIVHRKTVFVVEVLTLGINIWRTVGNTHERPNRLGSLCYFTGIVHWICGCRYDSHVEWICSLNISTEKLVWITPPPDCNGYERGRAHLELKVVRDCLCLLHYTHKGWVLWSMSDYGVAESWSKHVVWESQSSLQSMFVTPMWEDEFLFLGKEGYLEYFDYKEMKSVELITTIDDNDNIIMTDAYPFFPSFVPLFDIFKQQPSKVVARKRWFRLPFPFLKYSTSKSLSL